jgi:uncharacterized protein (DUF2336 family)
VEYKGDMMQTENADRMLDDKKSRAFDAKALLNLAQDNTQQGRNKLTQRICDFFKHKLSEEEERVAADILLNLIKRTELDFKQILAERLAAEDHVPRVVILSLADERISVAAHVLMHSSLLHDADLLFVLKNKAEEYWEKIALRKHLSPMVMTGLIETDHDQTIETLIRNQDIKMPEAIFKRLGAYVMSKENLQQPLLLRPEVDDRIATMLYVCVSLEVRRFIHDNYDIDVREVERIMQDTLSELLMQASGEVAITPQVMKFAEYAYERGEINAATLIKSLRRSQFSYFLAMFTLWAEMPEDSILAMIQRKNGFGLVAFCKAKGVQKSEFASLFLLSRGMRSGEKVVNHTELAKALTEFDRIKVGEATKLINLWRNSPSMI